MPTGNGRTGGSKRPTDSARAHFMVLDPVEGGHGRGRVIKTQDGSGVTRAAQVEKGRRP